MMRISFNGVRAERFRRGVCRRGGFQTLLRRIQHGIGPVTNVLDISEYDFESSRRYTFTCGNGGLQGRMGPTARQVWINRP